jgi:eukaryotic-like serine/threonine-protein kinase
MKDGERGEGQGSATVLDGGACCVQAPGERDDMALRVVDRYVLAERLGAGATAEVFAASDPDLGRSVALKALRPERGVDPASSRRFLGEVRLLAGLEHPGVVPVHEVGRLPSGTPFYTMRRVRGSTLGALLRSGMPGSLESRESMLHFVDLFERVCETVAAAHRRDIVHRDLKTENIMVGDDGEVFVVDWGLAKERELLVRRDDPTQTEAGRLLGTPAYMSPEAARGEADTSGCEADVFSLGVILYEILAGRRPFVGATLDELTAQILHTDPPSPRRLNPVVPRALAAICLKALKKQPRDRYRSAGELAAEVRAFREDRRVEAHTPGLLERCSRWARHHPALTAAAATLVATVLVVGTWLGHAATARRDLLSGGIATLTTLEDEDRRLEGDLPTARGRLYDAALPATERARRDAAVARLEAARDLLEARQSATLLVLLGFTAARPDPVVQRLAREHAGTAVERLIAAGRVPRAHALVTLLLTDARNRNLLGLDRSDVARLETTLRALEEQTPEARTGATP